MVKIEKELAMDFQTEHQKLFLNLLFTSNRLRHMDMERLRPHGLSPQQYNILRILRGANGRTIGHKGQARPGEQILIRVSDGEFTAHIAE